jgi:Na+:H+ antiporter, NhaC family
VREAGVLNSKIENIPLWLAFLPLIVLISLLGLNVWLYGDSATYGANQIALILAAAVAVLIGQYLHVPFSKILEGMVTSLGSSLGAMLILLLIGALSGTWMISGIVPAMIYYGLKILTPETFLVASLIVCSIVSVATGSSWTTVATVGVALIAIGNALGLNPAMTAGAIISGAYFGDKISPLSDTTNLAPAMAGTDVFTHVRYMLYTTVPTYIITVAVFWILSLNLNLQTTEASAETLLAMIEAKFVISPLLFAVPALVVIMVLMKFDALSALFVAMILGAVVAIIFQPQVINELAVEVNKKLGSPTSESGTIVANSPTNGSASETKQTEPDKQQSWFRYSLNAYNSVVNAMSIATALSTDEAKIRGIFVEKKYPEEKVNALMVQLQANPKNADLFKSKGMTGMLSTIWLVFCAMCFGGAMEAIGLLERITLPLVRMAQSTGSLIGTTVASCVLVNIAAADQYLAIVVPGRMFRKTFEDRGLAPENLSRTLEDAGTVTSVLVPWNTCGATQAGVLNVPTLSYLPYCVFNYVSPLMTVFFGAFQIAIRRRLEK